MQTSCGISRVSYVLRSLNPSPVNIEALSTKNRARLIRLAIFSASICGTLASTSLLSFVWEASVDGRSFRPLYSSHLIDLVFSALIAFWLSLGWLEFRGRLSFSVNAYPLLTILYFGFWWAVTIFSTNDFVISRSQPRTTVNQTNAGTGCYGICRVSHVFSYSQPNPKRYRKIRQ